MSSFGMRRVRGATALLVLLLAAIPAPAQVCGDCDLDAQVTILDALAAAQVGVGLRTLAGQALINCNVDDVGTVGVVDALLIARCAVGFLGVPCGLACSGLRVVVASQPIGTYSSTIVFDYTIFDDQSDPIDVVVTFSTDGGMTFAPASVGIGGDPVTGRPSAPSPTGAVSRFAWDTRADGIGGGCAESAVLVIAPFDGGLPGLAGSSSATLIYNPTELFFGGPAFPGGLPLQEHCQVTLGDGRVLLAGGTRNRATPTASAFLFDPVAGVTSSTGSMVRPRIAAFAVALDGRRVLIGGGFSSLAPLVFEDTLELYDSVTATFTLMPVRLPRRVAGASAVYFRARNRLLVLGGLHDDGAGQPVVSNEALSYRPDVANPAASVAGLWNAARFARYESTLTLLPGLDGDVDTLDDLAVVYGGSGLDPADPPTQPLPGQVLVHGFHVLGDAEIFDPSIGNGVWHQVNDNSYYRRQVQRDALSGEIGPRRQHAAVALEDGTVLFVGGHAQIDADPSSGAGALLPVDNRLIFAERLHVNAGVPSFSTIDPSGATQTVRVQPTATRLACGQVLVVGGYDFDAVGQPAVSACELFDPLAPAMTAWKVTDTLGEGRWLHGASLLADGRVLITGGEGGDAIAPFSLADSELFVP